MVCSSNTRRGNLTNAIVESRCIDKPGLLVKSHGDQLTDGQKPFARDDAEWSDGNRDLFSVVKKVHPHVLIGTSTKPGAFTEDIIREMAKNVDRPIVFPLSNPTRLHEAKPDDLYKWTDGQALIATGSPFPPVKHNGTEYEIGMFSIIAFSFDSYQILTNRRRV
jgi:malate dehydrogenase (oxaloacetate-decarboxylating)